MQNLYKIPKNTEVVIFGSSHSGASYSPGLIYKKFGIKSIIFEPSHCDLDVIEILFKEILKNKSEKKIFLIEAYSIDMSFKESHKRMIPLISQVALYMQLSSNKYSLANKINTNEFTQLNTFFPITKYHGNYKNAKYYSNVFNEQQNGFAIHQYTTVMSEINYKHILNRKTKFPDDNDILYIEKKIKKLKEIAEENKVKIVFYRAPIPFEMEDKEYIKKNVLYTNLLSKYGISYLDFNMLKEELKIDRNWFENTTYENIHTSEQGKYEISRFLGNYMCKLNICNIYEPKNESYINDYNILEKNIKIIELKAIKEYFSYISLLRKMPNITIIVSGSFEIGANMAEYNKILEILGLNIDIKSDLKTFFISAVESSGKKYFEKLSNSWINHRLYFGDNHIFDISSYINEYSIKFDGKEYSKNKEGLNFVIYDNQSNRIIDNVTINLKENPNFMITR
ncbi:hypothetical protein [Fusobacterium sp. PH5-44]|uniref:hypothetical protein n=1 Tax=unclassified Fusobacterium TaxID=2648384 RepID=UPI003D1A685E